jgi:hypothetical protein
MACTAHCVLYCNGQVTHTDYVCVLCHAANAPASSVYTDAADTVSTPLGQTATGNVLANANLPAGTTAQITGFSIAGSTTVYPAGSNVTLTDPVTGEPIGTLAIAADGSYTFDPVDGYIGPTPAVNVYSQASNGQTAVSSLTVDVLPCKLWVRRWELTFGHVQGQVLGCDFLSHLPAHYAAWHPPTGRCAPFVVTGELPRCIPQSTAACPHRTMHGQRAGSHLVPSPVEIVPSKQAWHQCYVCS